MNEGNIIIFGERRGWNSSIPFGISLQDHRNHVHIIGKTGSGKTTLLRNLLVQHVHLGHGVGLIDPHGDLAEELLDCIPSWRSHHLVHFNPTDVDFPVAMNPIANISSDNRYLVASGLVSAFKNIWGDSWGPRLEYILYNSLAAILDCPNTFLLSANRMLTDENYRQWIIGQIKDPFIKDFWVNEFQNYDPRFQREAIAPIQNKLGQFLLNPIIRNILGQVRRKIDFSFTMNKERVFIANLAKGKLGHDKANLLGSLLVTQFQLAAMERAAIPEEDRRDFILVIDEFQNFSTEAFASILSEARKYRLCLILSHQFIDQVAPSIQQAIMGNVGTSVSFHIGPGDAAIMERAFGNAFLAQQFVELGRHEIIVKLSENGESRYPFHGKTLPPVALNQRRKSRMIRFSRQRFTTSRLIVEDRLSRWISNRL